MKIKLYRDNTAIPTLRHLSFSFDADLDLDSYTKLLVKSNPQLTSLEVDYIGETPTDHLLLIRNSLPNLQRLTLGMNMIRVNGEPFKPLLFRKLRFLSISCGGSYVLKPLVITSTIQIDRLELSIDGMIEISCINFLKRHKARGKSI